MMELESPNARELIAGAHVALVSCDTKLGTDSSDLLKLARYARTEPIPS